MHRFGWVISQHRVEMGIAHCLAEMRGQGAVDVPCRFPHCRRILVAMRAHVVPRHKKAIWRQAFSNLLKHLVDVGNVVTRRMVHHQVERTIGQWCCVDVHLDVLRRESHGGRCTPRLIEEILSDIDPNNVVNNADAVQFAFNPPVTAVQHEDTATTHPARRQSLIPRHRGIARGALIEIPTNRLEVVPVLTGVVPVAIAGDTHAATAGVDEEGRRIIVASMPAAIATPPPAENAQA